MTMTGTQPPSEMEVEVDLYDSEILQIQGVLDVLNQARTRVTTVDGWRAEIEDRFGAIGFKVAVVLRELESVELPDGTTRSTTNTYLHTSITIKDRIVPEEEFDHDRQRHEVRADILGRNPKGSTKGVLISNPYDQEKRTASGLILPK